MPVDLRTRKLADLAVKYCVLAKPGEKVIISGGTEALPFLQELYKAVILAKAIPIVRVNLPDVSDFFYKYANKEQLEYFPQYWMDTVLQVQFYIGIDTDTNTRELSSINPKKTTARQKILHPISDYIVNTRDKIRRVTIAYPCISHAQEAEMSLTEWENFVYNSCLPDWNKLKGLMSKLKSHFKEGSKVHLLGENVNLKFKVHGKKAATDLERVENMPAGELFMAPIRESLNGHIKFEYPAIEGGKEVSDIYLKFEIGFNPKITKFNKNLLFDEKINGTIHLALGMAYKENGGGNDSAIHWDIVKDMKKAKIIVDNKIIQENGIWKI